MRFTDERKVNSNAHAIVGAVMVLPLVEDMNKTVEALIPKIADLQHRLHPVPNSD